MLATFTTDKHKNSEKIRKSTKVFFYFSKKTLSSDTLTSTFFFPSHPRKKIALRQRKTCEKLTSIQTKQTDFLSMQIEK